MANEFVARNGVIAQNNSVVSGSLNVSGAISAVLTNVAQPNFVAYNTTTGLFTYANTGSFTATSASFATTASYAVTASYVNPLRQTVTLTGSFNLSGSTTQIGTNTLLGNTLLSGSVIISGALGQPNPTLSIFGDLNQTGYTRYLPVVTNIDTNISASYIYVSGSTNDLYFSQNGSGYANTTRLRWIEGNLYTGLLSGGVLSSTLGSTTFNLSSGSGIIVALNASTGSTDPFPIIQYVKWPQQLNNPITYSGSAKITYVGINSSGTIVQQTVPFGSTDVTQWDTQIELGIVLHLSGSVSTGVYNAPQTAYGFAQRTDDFIRAFGPVKISGHTLQASGSTLGLTKTAGTAYNNGANYINNPNHPSTVTDPAINTSKIYRYYVSGSTPVIDTGVANAGYTAIDPTLYNNNGVLTTVPGSGANKKWSIQRVFWIPNSPTNAFLVYYGNDTYASSLDAQNGIQTEVFTEAPNTAQNAILIGYIIVRKDSTNLSDGTTAYITQGGLFRSVSGIGNSNTPSISNTLAGLSDVAISGPTQGDLLVYGGAQWNNLRSLTGPYSITGSLSFLNGGVTASLFGTASQALTASYLLGGGGVVTFPYSGSAQITGSLGVTGSVNITGSLSSAGAFSITNNISASNSSQLSFGPGTAAGSNLFLQSSGSSGTNAFEIRPYGVNAFQDSQSYVFRQPLSAGYYQNMVFDKNNASITIVNGNSDGGTVLSRPGSGESRLTSGISSIGTPGFLTFYTSGSERVRVDGTGSLLVGTSTNNGYATSINGTNATRFSNGALYVTGSSSFTGSINVSGGITGSLFGTASQAITASYALYALGGSANAILYQTASAATTWSFNHFLQTQYPVFAIYDSGNNVIIPQRIQAVDTSSALIYFSSPTTGVAVASKGGYSASVVTSATTANTAISASFASSGTGTFSGSFSGSFSGVHTGSLFGTASQAVSASYAYTASSAVNSSASLIAVSASYALTASYVLGGGSGVGFPFTGSAQITGSLGVTGSVNITGSLTVNGNISPSNISDTFFPFKSGSVLGQSILRQTDTASLIFGEDIVPTSPNARDFTINGLNYANLSLKVSGSLGSQGYILSARPGGSFAFTNIAGNVQVLSLSSDATSNVMTIGAGANVSFSNGNVGINWPNIYTIPSKFYVSGSTRLDGTLQVGTLLTDTHTFTGSVGITGSLAVSGSTTINGRVTATNLTGSLFGTASQALTASYLLGSVSSFPYSGSAQITGSLGVTGSLSVSGSATITGGLGIGTVNTAVGTIQGGTGIIAGTYPSINGFLSLNGQSSYAGTEGIIKNVTNQPMFISDYHGVALYSNGSLMARFGSQNAGVATSYINQGNFLIGTSTDNGYKLNIASPSVSGSLYVSGSSSFTGSINVSQGITGSLFGTASQALTASYLLGSVSSFPYSGSAQITGSLGVTGSLSVSGSMTIVGRSTATDLTGSLFGTSSQAVSASYAITSNVAYSGTGSFTGSFIGVHTGSLFGTASQALTASYILGGVSAQVFPYSGSAQITGSLGVTGSINSTGNITTTGTLTAQTLVVQTITSSIEYSSGSNIFGSRLTDTQTMTGSVNITGSLSSAGAFTVTNNVSASNSTQLSFGPGTSAGSNLFLQPSGSSGTVAFEIRAYGGNTYVNGGYAFIQPSQPGFNNNITFNQPSSTITIGNGNSDQGVTLSRPGTNIGEARLTSGNTGTNNAGYITLYTSGSERVRVDGIGSLLVGTTTNNGYLTSINGANTTNFPSGALYVTGSSSFTGSINVSGGITGSLFGTASQALTASYILGGVSAQAFPYSGSAQITGSLGVSGSVNITSGSLTLVTGSLTLTSASLTYQQNLSVAAGGYQVITAAPTASYRAAFFDYVMFSGSVVRAGSVTSTWSGSVTEYYENYTADLGGSTSGVTLQTALSTGNIQLQASSSTSAWTIRSLIRLL